MLYLVGALGIGGSILGLLVMYYRQKALRIECEKALVEVDRAALVEVIEITDRLKDEVSKDRREAMEARLRELSARIARAKPGERIEDVTGTGGGST